MIIIQLNHNKNMRVILILIILFSSFVLNAQVAKIPYVYATKGGKTELIAENAYVKMDKPTMEISIQMPSIETEIVFKIDNAIEASKEKSVMSGTVEGKSATFTVINKNNTMYLRVDTLLITVTNKKRED